MMFVAWLLAEAATANASSPTLQQQFEQATAALLAKQWDAALTEFRAVEVRPGLSPRTRSVIAMREGQALFRLDRQESADMLRKGLALAPPKDATLKDDRLDALLTLGGIERGDFDYVAARKNFEAALQLAEDPITKITSLMSLAGVTMFESDGSALGYVDEAIRLAAAGKADATLSGRLHDLRGRVLLNHGDRVGALAEFKVALAAFGGLTTRTDLDDVQVRADLTLTYLLEKNKDQARKYLGMTGEGRVPDNAMLHNPVDADLPICGTDIQPDDVAVIEFGLGDDGAVLYSSPVYASRPGPMALNFARAVYGWSWDPKLLKEVPLFYRVGARIEVRCSMATNRPSPIALLQSDVEAWLKGHGVQPTADGDSDARTVVRLRADLLRLEASEPNGVALVPVFMALGASSATTFEETRDYNMRAGQIAAARHAPPGVLTYFAARAAAPKTGKRKDINAYTASLSQMLQSPAVAGAPRSSATLRFILAQEGRTRDVAAANAYLNEIVADHRLDVHDPLKVGALLQLATIKAQQHDLAAAQHLYQLTGLNDQQCALVDAQPIKIRGQASESDYPNEAREWGISGWAKTEFDVKADGTTEHVRTVMAYPPFVFGRPMELVAARMKYTQSFRPQGGLGCGGETFEQGFHYIQN
jgi:hypothetical protein